MNLILTMSLAGSVIIILYGVLLPLMKPCFTARWRYSLLKLAAIFFLVPFPYYKQYYIDFLTFVFQYKRKEFTTFYVDKHHIQIDVNGFPISGISEIFNVFTVTWIGVAIVFFIFQIVNYHLFKRRILLDAVLFTDQRVNEIVNQHKCKLHMEEKVVVCKNKYVIEPFTIGIFYPVIFLPNSKYSFEELELILYHELCHIKNKDLFIKLCGLVALSLHWFNPFVYFLYREIGIVCENACDERIVLDQDMEFRRRYGRLIIETIEKKEIYSNALIISFSGNKKVTKERIRMMKNVKRPKRSVKVFSTVVAMSVTLLGSTTVLAYEGTSVAKWEQEILETKENLLVSEGSFSVNEDSENIVTKKKDNYLSDSMEIVSTKATFIDDNGNHYDLSNDNDAGTAQPHSPCNHNFQTGIYKLHTKFSNGGCRETWYDAKGCTKCQYVLIGEHVNTVFSEVCFH
ncbi:MAG: M56 family metallopeptidase [Lachnospiraceae bacterium]|nr:M56 family metallopeptidase [Lachnospiraceae bacterium]